MDLTTLPDLEVIKMGKKARLGPSKSALLREHALLFQRWLEKKATDLELSTDSAKLEAEGIPFTDIIAVRQKVRDHMRREDTPHGATRGR